MKDLIEDLLERFGVPGAAVAVVYGGDVVVADGFGSADLHTGAAVTPDTAFAIGSVTKSFTAAGVAALVDDGVLEWDRPLRHYLPDFEMHDPVASQRLTARDLLCHRSGLPRHELTWYGNNTLSRAELVTRLRYLQPNEDFRTTWQYNNLMYVTAGHLCEVLTGLTWEEHLSSRLLCPLGMTSTVFSHEQARELGPVSQPHDERDGLFTTIPYSPGTHLCGPAGSLYSTVADLVRWVQLHLGAADAERPPALSTGSLRELTGPQMVAPDASLFPELRTSAYGMGWFVGSYRGHPLVEHGGNIDGFSALVALLPEQQLAAVVLANRNATSLPQALAYAAFDRLLGSQPLPWAERFRQLDVAGHGGRAQAKARLTARPSAPLSHPVEEYVGDYEHPAYGTLAIELADGRLTARFHDLGVRLEHRHFDVFHLHIEAIGMAMPASFGVAADGEIATLSIAMEASVDPIVFTRAADPQLLDPGVLASLVGRYAMGPIELQINQARPELLTVTLPGLGTRPLEPHRGSTFHVRGMPGISLTFEVADGAAREVLVQPIGVFTTRPATAPST